MNTKPVMLMSFMLLSLMLHSSAFAADACQYRDAYQQAKNTLNKAAEITQIWSSSEILLEKAEKAAASGDLGQAIELADEARMQGELAMATAIREKTVWRRSVPVQAAKP